MRPETQQANHASIAIIIETAEVAVAAIRTGSRKSTIKVMLISRSENSVLTFNSLATRRGSSTRTLEVIITNLAWISLVRWDRLGWISSELTEMKETITAFHPITNNDTTEKEELDINNSSTTRIENFDNNFHQPSTTNKVNSSTVTDNIKSFKATLCKDAFNRITNKHLSIRLQQQHR